MKGMLDHAGMDGMMVVMEDQSADGAGESDQAGTLAEVKMHLKAAMRILSQLEGGSQKETDSIGY